MTGKGLVLLTLSMENAVYTIKETRDIPPNRSALSDEIIQLTGEAGKKCPHLLRKVTYYNPAAGANTPSRCRIQFLN